MKLIGDNKLNVPQNLKLILGRVENSGKRENVDYQQFLIFTQCF